MASRLGPPRDGAPRIGIVVVAYNAASTLAQVLDRIPAEFREHLDAVLVSDDASSDATYLVGLGYQSGLVCHLGPDVSDLRHAGHAQALQDRDTNGLRRRHRRRCRDRRRRHQHE